MSEKEDLPVLAWISHNPMSPGGFQTVTRNLLHRLDGYDIHVIGFEQGTSLMPYTYDGYTIYEVSSACGLRHYMNEISPDLVVVYGAYWHMSQYLQAISHSEFTQAVYLVVEAPPIPKKNRADLGMFEMIMTPSIASAQCIVDVGYDAYLVHHGVDHSIYNPGSKEESKFYYGSVKVNNYKAQLGRLLTAYATIAKATDSMLLMHTNPMDSRGAPLKDIVQTYDIEDHVRFSQPSVCNLGLPDAEMAQFYRGIDVYVSPSGADTVNLPALEAAASGVPSILSDIDGPKEYLGTSATYVPSIEDYPSGFGRVKLTNEKLLADALMEYYLNEDFRKQKGKEALEISRRWPWERAVDELKSNLAKLI